MNAAAVEIEKKFVQKVSKEVRLIPQGSERYRVFTPFMFDDGDHFSIVLKRCGDGWALSDEGYTYMQLAHCIDESDLFSGSRGNIISNTLAMFDVQDRQGELMLDIEGDDYGEALFAFVQALMKITDVSYLSRERSQRTSTTKSASETRIHPKARAAHTAGGKSMTQQIDTQDQYDRDAEFQHEERHLGAVVGWMDRRIADAEKPRMVTAGTVQAANIVVAMRARRLQELKDNRSRPYFGRIDYTTGSSGEVKTAYIGNFSSGLSGTPDDQEIPIVHRNTAIARLYYDPAGNSHRESMVYLKRMLAIEDAALLKIDDVLRLAAPSGFSQSSQILDERLSGASSEHLTDAIETLQPEQYAALSKVDSPVLIVQGAAGAGKSIVALQRIEFIASPHSDIGVLGRPRLDRIIMFGPSEAFLQYASELLPSLDVEGVQQSTITRWMLGQFSAARVALKGGEERVLNDLMNNTKRNRTLKDSQEAHLFKGSMKMKRILDKYVDNLRKEIRRYTREDAGAILSSLQLQDSISVADFRKMLDEAFANRPLNSARVYFIDRLAEFRSRNTPQPVRRQNSPQSEIINANRREINDVLKNNDWWPEYDFGGEYVRLMSGTDVIERYMASSDKRLSRQICLTVPRNSSRRSFGITDLAAALYLDYALSGFTSENFEHVVVDEAQDVTPLEMELLRMHSINQSFTILGDLKQGLLPHRSIANWNEFARLFQNHTVAKQEMRLTYRSTKQITQYANRIVKDLHGRGTKTPQPYGRAGERPEIEQHKSAADMYAAITDAIDELRGKDEVRSIAVLTKWESTAKNIMKEFRSERMEGVSRLEQGGRIETDIIVSPIVLTKGLEFDAVIVANADKNNFAETEFDRMLLYLACTRARHYLQIHWHGPRSAKSPIVPDTSRISR